MNKWVTLLAVYCLSAGCTSYKKAVTKHAVIDDKLERDKLILGRKEIDIDTSVWQNRKIVITDVEFYPAGEAGDLTGSNLYFHCDTCLPLKPTLPVPAYGAVGAVKRIRHVVTESLQEEQAHSNVSTADGAIEVSKVEINEQEDRQEDKRPVAGLISVYIFGLGVFSGLLFLLFLRKLF